MPDAFDVVVIGAGPAGYPAAIRAAQNGLKVACIDAWKNRDGSPAFGGTCLNAGCIPSKALLESSELYLRAKSEFAVHGIRVSGVELDLAAMQKRRAGIVHTMTGGVAALLKAAGATAIHGTARLRAGRLVEVTAPDGAKSEFTARHVILASGSVPTELKALPFDHRFILDSWDALELASVPKKLVVIGAGVIGLELGSVWRRLGAEVIVLEALENFLAIADQQLALEALRHLKKQGLDIRLGAKVTGATVASGGVSVQYQDASGGAHSLGADQVVVAVGRRPYSANLFA
ncbi:MAG TPA: FAD-dependent oxidoreductase, partial [Steroidobacteraceae bacterium]